MYASPRAGGPRFCQFQVRWVFTGEDEIGQVWSWSRQLAKYVSDVIDIRKRKFLVKYDLSDNLLCQVCKKCNDIVCYTVSALLKFIFFSFFYRFLVNKSCVCVKYAERRNLLLPLDIQNAECMVFSFRRLRPLIPWTGSLPLDPGEGDSAPRSS